MVPFDYNLSWKIFKLIRQNPGRIKNGPTAFVVERAIFALINLINKFFFLIDEILFFSYRKIIIKSPMFIIGPPRTGSTFLQRLLCESQDYTGMRMWESIFAPSITQKYLFLGFGKLDRLFGSPLYKAIRKKEQAGKLYEIHPMSFFDIEEDALIFTFTGNSPFLFMHYTFDEISDYFLHFDTQASDAYKAKYMHYYQQCIKKHLFVFGKNKTFISKNPSFSTYVHTLKQAFSDAKIVYLYRDPLNLVPSGFSLASFALEQTTNLEKSAIKKIVVEALNIYYLYPVRTLDFKQNNHHIIFYNDLTRQTAHTLQNLLERFNLPLSSEFKQRLDLADKKSKDYKSDHQYSLEEPGLSQEEITRLFATVYDHFQGIAPPPEQARSFCEVKELLL